MIQLAYYNRLKLYLVWACSGPIGRLPLYELQFLQLAAGPVQTGEWCSWGLSDET